MCGGTCQQRFVNGLARGVGGVGDAPHRMPSLAGEMQPQRAQRVRRKRHARSHQPLHGTRAVLGDVAGGVLVHQAGARFARVTHMRLDTVVAA